MGNAADMPIGKIRTERKRLREETEARRQQGQMPSKPPTVSFGMLRCANSGTLTTHMKCTLP